LGTLKRSTIVKAPMLDQEHHKVSLPMAKTISKSPWLVQCHAIQRPNYHCCKQAMFCSPLYSSIPFLSSYSAIHISLSLSLGFGDQTDSLLKKIDRL